MAHPYATAADMVIRYGLARINSFPDVTIGTAETLIDEIMLDASREMDGYFEKYGYIVPLAPSTPGRAKDVCRRLAMYWLHDDPESMEASDKTIRDYESAIKWLEDVAAGKVKLGTDIEIELDSTAQDKAQFSLTKDDLRMTQGNSSEGAGRNSLGTFAINDDESGATGETP